MASEAGRAIQRFMGASLVGRYAVESPDRDRSLTHKAAEAAA
jgi:hypothetical protein